MSDEEKNIPENENGASKEADEKQPDLAAEVEKLRQELLYQRADFENVRKRLYREQEQAIKFGSEKLITELLNVVDLFELALGSSQTLRDKKDKDVNNYLVGIEMTHKQLLQTLEKMGVEMVGAVGEKFDPSRHEAVSQVPVDDKAKVGTILQVANRGGLLHGRLLKPARVVVADGASASE